MRIAGSSWQARGLRIALSFIVASGLLFFLIKGSAWAPWRKAPPLLALCISRTDNVAKAERREILVLARQDANDLVAVEEPTGPAVPLERSTRAALLRENPVFTVFQRGRVLDTVKLDSMGHANFDCEELVIGTAAAKVAREKEPTPLSPLQRRTGSSPGKPDVSYTIAHRLAMNSASASATQQRAAVPVPEEPPPETERLVRNWAAGILGPNDGGSGAAAVDMASPVVYRAAVDGGKVFVMSGSRLRPDGATDSMAAVVAVVRGAVVPLMTETTTESSSSWGRGYHFLDAIDMEGDGSPELVFQVDGYETTGFQVFKFKDGRCVKVLDLMAWGC